MVKKKKEKKKSNTNWVNVAIIEDKIKELEMNEETSQNTTWHKVTEEEFTALIKWNLITSVNIRRC